MKNSSVSPERMELVREAAMRQLRAGHSLEKVEHNLEMKRLEPQEAKETAAKAYEQFLDEKMRSEFVQRYNQPLVPLPKRLLGAVFRGVAAWILSVITGHLWNPSHLGKRDEKRIE